MENEIVKSLTNLEGRMLGLKVVASILLRASIHTPEERQFFLNGLKELFHGIEQLQAFHNEEIGEDLYAGLHAVRQEFLQIVESMPISEPPSFHPAAEHLSPIQTAVNNWWPWGR